MSGSEIHELAVRIHPEGVSETTEGLEDVEDQFGETVDSVEDSSREVGDFSRKWKGAMAVVAGAVSVATLTMARRMPTVQEQMSQFDMTMNTLALAFDEELRPEMQDVNKEWSEMRDEIQDTDGTIPLILTTFDNLFDVVGETSAELFNMDEAFGAVSNAIRESPIGTAIDKFNELDEKVTNAVLGVNALNQLSLDDFVNAVKKGLDGVIEKVRNLIDKFKRLAGVSTGGGDRGADQDPSTPEHDVFAGTPTISERRRAAQFESIPGLPVLQSGGLIKQTGAAIVERGEQVIPPADVDRSGGREDPQIVSVSTPLHIDGRKVGEQTKAFNIRGVLNAGRGARL